MVEQRHFISFCVLFFTKICICFTTATHPKLSKKTALLLHANCNMGLFDSKWTVFFSTKADRTKQDSKRVRSDIPY